MDKEKDSGFLFFPIHPKQGSFTLEDPCLLDCETKSHIVTLLIDVKNSRYLFILIDGDMRRCIDLSEDAPSFETREDAMRFLQSWRDSQAFEEMAADEESMDKKWDSL
ncbi:MAG: hypothetical protein JXR73_01510 [Candidatus Omnitrophica bacterium]|nr:hypothetical protein [Candidatus Omnitrophota bacterium]